MLRKICLFGGVVLYTVLVVYGRDFASYVAAKPVPQDVVPAATQASPPPMTLAAGGHAR